MHSGIREKPGRGKRETRKGRIYSTVILIRRELILKEGIKRGK